MQRALRALVGKLESIHDHPRFKAVWEYAHLRLGAYDGPTYTNELRNAKVALAAQGQSLADSSGSNPGAIGASKGADALTGVAPVASAPTNSADAPAGALLDLHCDEFMPLSLVPLANPNHDPGEHQVMDAETAYIFKIIGSRERAERIVAVLNAAAALSGGIGDG